MHTTIHQNSQIDRTQHQIISRYCSIKELPTIMIKSRNLCIPFVFGCLSVCATTQGVAAAKEGDSGDGWVVKSYIDDTSLIDGKPTKILYCEYNGTFRFRPNPEFSCRSAKNKAKYLTSDSLKCSNKNVGLSNYTKSRRQKFRLQAVKQKGSSEPYYNIVEDKGKDCSAVYLSCPKFEEFDFDYEGVGPIDWPTIDLTLSSSNKWVWALDQDEFTYPDLDCLVVNLRTENYDYSHPIKANDDCDEIQFDYSPNFWGNWILEPANEQ